MPNASFGYAAEKTASDVTRVLFDDAHFSTTKRSDGEVTLINLTSPLGQPETIRRASSEVKNVYANSGINPNYWSVNTTGRRAHIAIQNILRVSSTTAAGVEVWRDLPITFNLTYQVPNDSAITNEILVDEMSRLLGQFFGNGETVSGDAAMALLRGVVSPCGC